MSVELFWNATGNLSQVPTDRAQVTVHGPAGITDAACFQGAAGSRDQCSRNDVSGDSAVFEADGLGPREGLTVVVALPKDAVAPPPTPILEESHTLAWGFRGTPGRVGASAVTLLAAGAGVGLLAYRKGRDQRAVGSAVDVAFADERSVSQRRPLFERQVGPVQFEPPDHMPAGLFGTLVDERADVRDVSATIVDLAVRGYLRIEELEPTGSRRRDKDYRLVALKPADDRLRPYEALLLGHLFADGESVELSSLMMHFHPQMTEVRDAMYKEVVAQGWYRARPDRTRRAWTAIGVMAVLAAAAVTALLAATVGLGPGGAGPGGRRARPRHRRPVDAGPHGEGVRRAHPRPRLRGVHPGVGGQPRAVRREGQPVHRVPALRRRPRLHGAVGEGLCRPGRAAAHAGTSGRSRSCSSRSRSAPPSPASRRGRPRRWWRRRAARGGAGSRAASPGAASAGVASAPGEPATVRGPRAVERAAAGSAQLRRRR